MEHRKVGLAKVGRIRMAKISMAKVGFDRAVRGRVVLGGLSPLLPPSIFWNLIKHFEYDCQYNLCPSLRLPT